MLRRFAAAFLSLSLLASAADARSFARPPAPTEVAPDDMPDMRMPMAPVSRAEVLKALAARRAKNLAAFRAYRKGGVYPHNTIRSGPLNVWIDDDGHLCAAATMIAADGRRDLVDQVAATNTNLRLLDVTDGPVMDWLLTSGFTLEEIDRIQAPMVLPSPVERTPEWRMAEDARLRRGYVATDAWLVKHRKAGLAMAADRLMEHPGLARALVDAT
ncbi:MAG: hypothetical protein K8W52_42150 [Deltaproteobacteria bacterium]|nr:hypothetical protein [Deltaproteobacteria bacterium]